MNEYNKKMTKRLNQRLLDFEKQGLTNSRQYNYIIGQAKLHGALTNSKSGKLRISENSDMSASDLNELSKTKTANKIIKEKQAKLRAEGNDADRQSAIDALNEEGELSAWVENNLDSIYNLQQEFPEASFLHDMLKKGDTRHLSYSQIWDRIHEFEKARDKWRNPENGEIRSEHNFMRFTERWNSGDNYDGVPFS